MGMGWGCQQKPPATQEKKASAGERNRERGIEAKMVQRTGDNGDGRKGT